MTYDVEHGQWQAKVVYADEGEGNDGSADDGTDVDNDEVIIPSDGTSTDDGN